ncbi:hypothetical protein [Rhodovulum sp.]|nr:hypothetical protein [Rhodovulum sp.]
MNIPARHASGYLGDIDMPRSGPGDAVLHDMLATRPAAEALTLAPPG